LDKSVRRCGVVGFEKFVRKNKELVEQAEKIGVDVKSVFNSVWERYRERYSEKTIFTRVRAALRREIRAKTASKIKGIIAGSRDRFGKSWPIRLAVVRSSGEHIEVSTWSYENVKIGNGSGEVPVPSIAELSVQKDEQYGSYQLLKIEQAKRLSSEEAVEKLLQVAVEPSELDESSLYKIVVVKGVINAVVPATRFEDGEPAGTYPVLTEDAREKPNTWPTMQIWLRPDDDTRCRLILERPRYSKPHYAVEDLFLLCDDATELKDHVEQAQYVQDGLEGRSVIAVGVMLQYNKTRLADGTPVNYVDIGVAGLYEYEGEPKQSELTRREEEEEAGYEPAEEEEIDMTQFEDEEEDIDLNELFIDLNELFEEEKKEEKQEEESEESVMDEMAKIAQYVIDNAKWQKGNVEKLDKALEKYKGDLPATVVTTSFTESGKDGVSSIIAARFCDDAVAALKISPDGVYGYCNMCKKGCKHILTLWQYPGKQKYEVRVNKEQKNKEEESGKEETKETDIEKVKKLIRAYCRALNLPYSSIDEGTATEKLGIRDVPVSVIKRAIEELREEADA